MNDLEQLLPWLDEYWSQLVQVIKQQRIPQALLFSGNKGVGKHVLARRFAQALLCLSPSLDGNGCGQCRRCKLFLADTHPDYKMLAPDETGKAITVSMVRQLTTQLSLKPQFDGQRVVIINPADKLNNAAANAFLKYLEEPTERTTLILIAEKPTKLPATICSRCQKLFISTPNQSDIEPWLKKHGLLENSKIILSLSKGSPLLVQQFSENTTLELRQQCFVNWKKLSLAKTNAVEIAAVWCKLEKIEVEYLLFWITSWVMDIIKLAHICQSEKLYNPDLLADLQEMTQKLDLKCLYKYYDFLLLSQKQLDTQINKQLMFEEILIQWSTLNKK
ncbi:MAG: DNA polymerase III subunit delta' [Methylococcales symbiont of Hymedesmia sp. n. MRB-2018]|nr:MAG: DNA polymerase III subunit delta' [Methylococcales symbiont of Hymedesmia sp. n. MRB-2018]